MGAGASEEFEDMGGGMECKLPLQRVLDWRNTSRDFEKKLKTCQTCG